jgi:hypothetical protein
MQNDLRYELQNVLSGKSKISFGTTIQAIANYLKNGETTSPSIEIAKHFKSEETQRFDTVFFLTKKFWMK